MNENEFRIEFNDQGHLCLRGWEGHRFARCCVCGEEIGWCLDMFSFQTMQGGEHRLGHARCLWLPEAFEDQRRKAERRQGAE